MLFIISLYTSAFILLSVKVHAGSVCVSAIHRNLMWPTGSLICIRHRSYACIYYTDGGYSGTPASSEPMTVLLLCSLPTDRVGTRVTDCTECWVPRSAGGAPRHPEHCAQEGGGGWGWGWGWRWGMGVRGGSGGWGVGVHAKERRLTAVQTGRLARSGAGKG